MKISHSDLFHKIISEENLFISWREFRKGKKNKIDVFNFEKDLETNLFNLHTDLATGQYRHSDYTSFFIYDPKVRHIFKACVRDRIVHHAVFRIIYPIFDQSFIYDSYSCRLDKGTHRVVNRLTKFARKISQNYTSPCFALKCDISKFFDSVDHHILFNLIQRQIKDQTALDLIAEIILSYKRERIKFRAAGKGLPIGNLTSQLFANIYLNELDHFLKDRLKIKYYVRYCDDFVILEKNQIRLQELIQTISQMLKLELKLELHPKKVIIRNFRQGIDFCGYVVMPYYRILRTKTKKRLLRKITQKSIALKARLILAEKMEQSMSSYLGLMKHCRSNYLKNGIKKRLYLTQEEDFWYN